MTISLSHFITQQFSPCLSHSPPVLSSHFLEGLKLCLSPQLHVSSARLTSFLPCSLEDVAMIFRLEMGMDSSDTMMLKRAILAVPGQHPAHPVVLQAMEAHLWCAKNNRCCCPAAFAVRKCLGCLAGTLRYQQ